MKLLLDMNLGREWQRIAAGPGVHVRHWRDVGEISAPDTAILAWARANRYVVITKDLDFPQLLFATRSRSPSVVLLRIRDTLAPGLTARVYSVVMKHAERLDQGCLLVIDEKRVRLRQLPIQGKQKD